MRKIKNTNNNLGFIILLGIALIGAVVLVQRSQETRKGAYFANADLVLLPSEVIEKRVGESVDIHLKGVPGTINGSDASPKIQNVKAVICYDNHLELPEGELGQRVVEVEENGYTDVVLAFIEEKNGKKCLNVTVVSDNIETLNSQAADVAVISFRAKEAGEGSINIIKEESLISGPNSESIDKAISIGNVNGTNYRILTEGEQPTATPTTETEQPTATPTTESEQPTATPTQEATGETPTLKFEISFLGVTSEAKCSNNWPLRLTVMGSGESRVYPITNMERKGTVNNRQVFLARTLLEGFEVGDRVSVFLKGPKHLQVKYGVDNQAGYYTQAGGEIVLTQEDKVFDFSKYPLLAGDVTGSSNGGQDGIIDGRDFSLIKAEAAKRDRVGDGEYLLADLDGDCINISRDVTILMQSLKERQGQLY